jgi:putative DNA primase/helicase
MPAVALAELKIEPSEPEILLSPNNCLKFKLIKLEDQTIEVPVSVLIHDTAAEIRKVIPLVTIEETGSMLYYKDGVYIGGGEAKVEALLHRSFHGFEVFDPIKTPKKVIAHLKGLTMVSKDKFDDNLEIINMKNGLYNWRKKILYKHSPDHLSLIQIPVKYDPDAKCPQIETVLKRVLATEDITKFMEFAAYCLYRLYQIQKAFILLGPGQTGKSYLGHYKAFCRRCKLLQRQPS